VVTSIGVIVGVFLVWITGWHALDPAVAIAAAGHIAWTGFKVVRGAIAGLMNEADAATLSRIARGLRQGREPAAIEIHGLRAWTAGAAVHVDFHLVLPSYWSVTEAHDLGGRAARRIEERFAGPCEVIVHLDPCAPEYCPNCTVEGCSIRTTEFERLPNEVWQSWDDSRF
jgi:cation diffusion facilitator family transporter